MARQWIKMHTKTLHDLAFRRLSVNARYTFLCLPLIAADCGDDGSLCIRSGALTDEEIATITGLPLSKQVESLKELVESGFVATHTDAGYMVANWDKYQPSLDNTSTERSRRFRAMRDGNGDATVATALQRRDDRDGNGSTRARENKNKNIDKEQEEGSAASSSRPPEIYDEQYYKSRVQPFAKFALSETTPEQRRDMGRLFAYRFSNTRNANAVERRAADIAKSLVTISESREYSHLSVADYFEYMRKAWEATRTPGQIERGLKPQPTFDPWLFKAAVVIA